MGFYSKVLIVRIKSISAASLCLYLEIRPQPLVLSEDQIKAVFQIEIDFSGKGDDMSGTDVPATHTHTH